VQIDTKNILFLCGGAFVGLENQIAQRLTASSIGFGNPIMYLMSLLCPSESLPKTFWHQYYSLAINAFPPATYPEGVHSKSLPGRVPAQHNH
jgi:hypothetical protein